MEQARQVRIGLMGGTFDPPHSGHLILAEQAWEQLGLERVLFVTAGDPVHKAGETVTEAAHRHEMTRLAVEGNEHFVCSNVEINRPGPSYTIDTIRKLLAFHVGQAQICLLVGADEAVDFMSWRDPYGIQKLATVVVANRPGFTVEDTLAALPADFAQPVQRLAIPGVDISSTGIRQRVRLGQTIRYLVPEAVEGYILANGLYRGRL